MKQTIETIVEHNDNGLFLLDPPTGFGKTTAVLEVIKDFLSGNPLYAKVKKIFFVTNLITNLPFSDLLDKLTEDEKGQCFQAKATVDYILERFLNTKITVTGITSSKEYSSLKRDIEAYWAIQESLNQNAANNGLRTSLSSLKDKISRDTEPKFRGFIKSNYLVGKSVAEKNKFIDENSWLTSLYPTCNIDKYKVIFLTTLKFISPIDIFRRLSFYSYNDAITKDSIVFIDEFDSTKDTLLKQIVADGIKNRTDLISLFLDLHFALDNIILPKELLRTSEYHKKKVEKGEWHDSQWHYDHWRQEFKNVYNAHNLSYILKSVDFANGRAFLYDDGRYFNVFKDSSKKFIYVELDTNSDSLSLRAKEFSEESMPINRVLRDIEFCIDGFIEALFFIFCITYYFYNFTREEEVMLFVNLLTLMQQSCSLPAIYDREVFQLYFFSTNLKIITNDC